MRPASTTHSTTNPQWASDTVFLHADATKRQAAPTPPRTAAEKTATPPRATDAKQQTCPATLTRTPSHPNPRPTTTWPPTDATHLQGQPLELSSATTAPARRQVPGLQPFQRDAHMKGSSNYSSFQSCAPCVHVSPKRGETTRQMLCHLCHSTAKHTTNNHLRTNRYTSTTRHMCHYPQKPQGHNITNNDPKTARVAHLLLGSPTRAHTRPQPDLANTVPLRPRASQ